MLTVFANIRVNSDEEFGRLRDSFESFEDAGDQWLINVRGNKRLEVLEFLRKRLGGRAVFFELLDDSRGWATNSLEMIEHARNPYVLVWIEDHMCVVSPTALRHTVEEMAQHKIDYLLYSWWQKGRARAAFEALPLGRGELIDTVVLTEPLWRRLRVAGHPYYLVSMAGIFRKEFLTHLLCRDLRKLPYAATRWLYRFFTLLNRLGWRFDQRKAFAYIDVIAGYRFRRFPKQTPFDIEKPSYRTDILPLRLALSTQELFACIDDDNSLADRGSSLIARGLYPVRDRLVQFKGEPPKGEYPLTVSEQRLIKGEKIIDAYYFGGIKGRVHFGLEGLFVLEGHVRVDVKGDALELAPGQGAYFYTNVPHSIEALQPSIVRRFLPDTDLVALRV